MSQSRAGAAALVTLGAVGVCSHESGAPCGQSCPQSPPGLLAKVSPGARCCLAAWQVLGSCSPSFWSPGTRESPPSRQAGSCMGSAARAHPGSSALSPLIRASVGASWEAAWARGVITCLAQGGGTSRATVGFAFLVRHVPAARAPGRPGAGMDRPPSTPALAPGDPQPDGAGGLSFYGLQPVGFAVLALLRVGRGYSGCCLCTLDASFPRPRLACLRSGETLRPGAAGPGRRVLAAAGGRCTCSTPRAPSRVVILLFGPISGANFFADKLALISRNVILQLKAKI